MNELQRLLDEVIQILPLRTAALKNSRRNCVSLIAKLTERYIALEDSRR